MQQLREAFPFDAPASGSGYLVFDRDAIFSAEVVAAIVSMAIDPTRTSYQSPWQNGVAERFVATEHASWPHLFARFSFSAMRARTSFFTRLAGSGSSAAKRIVDVPTS
jgi:hypothetical protein